MKFTQLTLFSVLLAGLLMAGCFGEREVSEEAPAPLRSPHPTFTPTPVAPATPAPPTAAPAAPAAVESAPATGDTPPAEAAAPLAGDAPAALAVINEDLINIRRGPGLEYPPIKLGMRGDQFTIIGRSADDLWWQVCCVEELPAWISKTYVDSDGSVDSIPVADPNAAAQASVILATAPPASVATSAPTVESQPVVEASTQAPVEAAPPTTAPPTDTPAPAFAFALTAQESFPENNDLVRVFLYVFQGDQALPGYTLRVKHDGAELPVGNVSADAAGMTWPTASPRQRFQNMKVEFPGVNPGGVWEVQLIDGGGAPVGPPAIFTMTATDANRELYVRYEQP